MRTTEDSQIACDRPEGGSQYLSKGSYPRFGGCKLLDSLQMSLHATRHDILP